MSDTMTAPPGYGFVRHISEGGFGTVIEVEENSTGEHFARHGQQTVKNDRVQSPKKIESVTHPQKSKT
ncbi:hypothetical protein BLNAU_5445 [Blattamonas nauphoetae]|uniref:Uncharacterized protein n=1 Tax=Blattamonas nauphoetae TaxID=2049346 RepID=A0ABQ9Y7C6_9EUKA|nr:hypothetical protein BLNAU_5445 [Blattamonas nauphoetae]